MGNFSFLGKTDIVLYFYPRDHTAVCTAEACAFRDGYERFTQAGAAVIGISSDSVESHRQFAAAHQLPFILLSDTDGIIRKRYGVPTAFGLPGRVTYIIDRQGRVRRDASLLSSRTELEYSTRFVQNGARACASTGR